MIVLHRSGRTQAARRPVSLSRRPACRVCYRLENRRAAGDAHSWQSAPACAEATAGKKDGSKGLPAATALKNAQEFVKGHEKWRQPYYWAAWQLWGLAN